MHTFMHTGTHIHDVYTYVHAYTHTCMYIPTFAYAYIHTYSHIYVDIRTLMHAHIHIRTRYTLTYIVGCKMFPLRSRAFINSSRAMSLTDPVDVFICKCHELVYG